MMEATLFPEGERHRRVLVLDEPSNQEEDWLLVRDDVDSDEEEEDHDEKKVKNPTKFCFRSHCSTTMFLSKHEPSHLLLRGPGDLSRAGLFETGRDAWRRLWVTAGSGVGLSLLEDVPAEAPDGENGHDDQGDNHDYDQHHPQKEPPY